MPVLSHTRAISSTAKTRVMIVDDSAVVRSQLRRKLTEDSGIEVVGAACEWTGTMPAPDNIVPDVIVLDIELPSLRGPGRIREVIEKSGSAVIVLASMTGIGAASAVEALAAGAVDAVAKPGSSAALELFGANLVRKIHDARLVRPLQIVSTDNLLAISGSTGEVKPLVKILSELKPDAPATLVVQQLPDGFSTALVRYLSARCSVRIKEAQTGDGLEAGQVLLAPAGRHMLLRETGSKRFVEVKDGPTCRQESLFLRSVLACIPQPISR
jgi:two-component system chemotaxis response regulator CheB